MKIDWDVIVVGGGPAGLAAACGAKKSGAQAVLVIERNAVAGGILNQCVHSGFGLHFFGEELTGPEYASRFRKKADETGVVLMTDTTVLSVENRKVTAVSASNGLNVFNAKAVVLAMGCRERTRGAIAIPGDRPSGVITAGTAQRYINIEGLMPGKRVVILGSGDIGLIMARRLTLEGAKVIACVEICPYSNGLNRNIVQCLNDYGIPLYLRHTITKINGKHRVESVEISEVDENNVTVSGAQRTVECDTVLLSVGLIPENELSKSAGIEIDCRTGGAVVYDNRETMTDGVFACGNVLHVHDLVDFVTEEGMRAGHFAALYSQGKHDFGNGQSVEVNCGNGVRYTVPQKIRTGDSNGDVEIFFRVVSVYGKSKITVSDGEKTLCSYFRQYMAPGEMEKITVPFSVIGNAVSGSITVSVEEVVK